MSPAQHVAQSDRAACRGNERALGLCDTDTRGTSFAEQLCPRPVRCSLEPSLTRVAAPPCGAMADCRQEVQHCPGLSAKPSISPLVSEAHKPDGTFPNPCQAGALPSLTRVADLPCAGFQAQAGQKRPPDARVEAHKEFHPLDVRPRSCQEAGSALGPFPGGCLSSLCKSSWAKCVTPQQEPIPQPGPRFAWCVRVQSRPASSSTACVSKVSFRPAKLLMRMGLCFPGEPAFWKVRLYRSLTARGGPSTYGPMP